MGGMPDWISPYGDKPRIQGCTESELSGRQAGKPCGARVWLVLHKFPPLWRKTSEALSDRASEVFCGSSQIVV